MKAFGSFKLSTTFIVNKISKVPCSTVETPANKKF